MNCEFCGTNKDITGNSMHEAKYNKYLAMRVCMRCVDKLLAFVNDESIDECWEDAEAMRSGFEPFPMTKLASINKLYYKKRFRLVRELKNLDYEELKRKEE